MSSVIIFYLYYTHIVRLLVFYNIRCLAAQFSILFFSFSTAARLRLGEHICVHVSIKKHLSDNVRGVSHVDRRFLFSTGFYVQCCRD